MSGWNDETDVVLRTEKIYRQHSAVIKWLREVEEYNGFPIPYEVFGYYQCSGLIANFTCTPNFEDIPAPEGAAEGCDTRRLFFVESYISHPVTQTIRTDLGFIDYDSSQPGGGAAVECDFSIPITVSMEVNAELHVKYGNPTALKRYDTIFEQYTIDQDPYGSVPSYLWYYYVPTSDVTVKLRVNGELVSDEDIDPGLSNSDWYGGIPVHIDRLGCGATEESAGAFPDERFVEAAVCSVDTRGTSDYYKVNAYAVEDVHCYAELDLGYMRLFSDGLGSDICMYRKYCGAYDFNVSGHVYDIDESPRENVRVELHGVDGTPYDTTATDENGRYELEKHFEGVFDFGFGDPDDPLTFIGITKDDGGDRESGFSTHNAPTLFDIENYKEPDFPMPGMDNETKATYGPGYLWYNDSRMEFKLNEFRWADAVSFSAPMSKTLHTFKGSDHGEWSVVSGSATISNSGGNLKVEVDSKCIIKRSVDDLTFAGFRYFEVDYTGDDAAIRVDGKQYDISPNTKFDILAQSNKSPSGSVSYHAYDTTPAWGFGVYDVSEIAFVLEPGTYTFRKHTGKRLTLEEGGFFRVLINEGAFVGASIGESRENDPHNMFDAAVEGFTNPKINRIGVAMVDGVVGLEIFGAFHYQESTGEGDEWVHRRLEMGSPDAVWPTNSAITLTPDDDGGWRKPAREMMYIKPGISNTTGSNAIKRDWQARATQIRIPFQINVPDLIVDKHLRGCAHLNLLKEDGSRAVNAPVKLTTYDNTSKSVIAEDHLTTNGFGRLWTPCKPQPIVDKGVIGTIHSSTSWTVTGLKKNYTGYTLFFNGLSPQTPQYREIVSHNLNTGKLTLDSAPDEPPMQGMAVYVELPYSYKLSVGSGAKEVSVEYDLRNRDWVFATMRRFESKPPERGRNSDLYIDSLHEWGYTAYEVDGDIKVRWSDDYGKTWRDPIQITNSGDACEPCVIVDVSLLGRFGVLYREGGDVKITWTRDGFENRIVDVLPISGIKYIRYIAHPVSGVTMLAGWRESDEKLVSYVSFDDGENWELPVEIAQAPEQSFGLSMTPSLMGVWAVTFFDSNDELNTYWCDPTGTGWTRVS